MNGNAKNDSMDVDCVEEPRTFESGFEYTLIEELGSVQVSFIEVLRRRNCREQRPV